MPGLLAHEGAEVVAICGNARRARTLADKFGIADALDDVEALCRRDDIDAITIASRNSNHLTQALTAFRHGKHVFCEKPLGVDTSECRAMLDAAHSSGRVHRVAFVFRYNYGVRELRRRVRDGDIGEPFYCRIQYDNWDRLKDGWQPGWRDLAGHGLLMDMGPHLFDIARFAIGPIERAIGFTQKITRSSEARDDTADDLFNAWTRHSGGVRGQFFVSRATPSLTRNGYLEVIGTDGALKAALSRGAYDSLEASKPSAPEWVALPLPPAASDKQPHCLALMMGSFVDACLRSAPDPEVDATFEDGLAAQQAIEATLVSESTGRWTEIDGAAH